VEALFARCGGNVLATLDDAQLSSSLPNVGNDKSLSSFDNSLIANPQANGIDRPPPSRPNMDDPIFMPDLPPWQMRQISLQEGMNSTTKQNLHQKWATFFYETNIPFNVAHHLAFIDAMKFTSKEKYFINPPSYIIQFG
jgi:hypothetical protein